MTAQQEVMKELIEWARHISEMSQSDQEEYMKAFMHEVNNICKCGTDEKEINESNEQEAHEEHQGCTQS